MDALARHPQPLPRPLTMPSSAVADTTAGRVRGYLDGEVYTYLGVPYGASTAGRNRFRAPQPPTPWRGARLAMTFGAAAPQHTYPRFSGAARRILDGTQFEHSSEDCLHLNVWSRHRADGARRPVMVWLHGGAFLVGSANRPQTWGANLARNHDVVVVSIHHRLNVLGFLDLSVVAPDLAESANAGMLDIVAALEWVRDNIEQFGGDPSNVTVFGNSGGGAKVATLMAMPPARGLFHRAIVQSTSGVINEAEESERLSRKLLDRLGITRRNLADLADVPVEQLVDAGTEVSAAPLEPGDNWRPKLDGTTIVQQPFDPAALSLSADIPVMLGGSRHEFAPEPDRGPVSDELLGEMLGRRFGPEQGRGLVGELRALYPGISNNEVLALVNVQPFRANHLKQATRVAQRGGAALYYYSFAWTSPNLDGLPLAYHGSELPFVFGNIAECALLTGNSEEAYAVSDVVSRSWVAFATTGDPNWSPSLRWEPFDPERRNTMVFDRVSGQVDHPWRAETEVILAAAGGMFPKAAPADLLRT